jgi:hypothetical protein
LVDLELTVLKLARLSGPDWSDRGMITSIDSFPWFAESVFEKRLCVFSIALVFLQRSENLLEVEIGRESGRLCPGIGSETAEIELFSDLHGFMSTQSEALGPNLEKLDGV